jgi:Fe-Mn family superoxide dismutase
MAPLRNQSGGLTRRQALKVFASIPAVSLARKGDMTMTEEANPAVRAPAYRGDHQVRPLPFDPAKLRGLSTKLMTSHHENNYGGAVKRLNAIEQQIGKLPADAAPFQMGSLKREELIATNSMHLHELYFANLGGEGGPSGRFAALVRDHYGSLDAWERDFRLSGMSLAGGPGWVLATYDVRTRGLHNYWAWDHTHSLAGGMPVLVMDMYEHSYHLDYGANAKGYVDAFFQNVQWSEVSRRLEQAERIGGAS